MNDGKSVVASKVFWLNVAATVAAVVDILTAGQLLPAGYLPYAVAGVAILNVILRVWFTDAPITSVLPK